MYTSDIWVGNPPQKLRALFDTGSQNTWILSKKSQLNRDAQSRFHYFYDEEKSSTSRSIGAKHAQAKFGSGELKGHFITDDLRVGLSHHKYMTNGLMQNNNDSRLAGENEIHIPNFEIGIIDEDHNIFDRFNFDAIVGMTYTYQPTGVKPFLDQIIA